MVANTLGDIVGETVFLHDHTDYSSSLNFLRVRVLINPRLPLIQRIRVNLDSGISFEVECIYEKIFRHCHFYRIIGHTQQECPRTVHQAFHGFNWVHARTVRRFSNHFQCFFD